MLGHGAGEDDLLEVLAFQDEALGSVLVGDAGYILLDDRAGIQFRRHIVARGADNLDTTLLGLMIRLRADEGRQEGMVDIDDVVRIGGNHLVAENLHVTS